MGRKAVKMISPRDLVSNGGQYKMAGRVAVRAVNRETSDDITGGHVIPVYVIPDDEIDNYKLSGETIEVYDATELDRPERESFLVVPVYDVLGTLLVEVEHTTATIVTGTEISGSDNSAKDCEDEAYWQVQEEAGGIDVQFSFYVQGSGKKVKIKGKSSADQDYSLQAWDGNSWQTIETLEFNTSDSTYTVDLGSQYTIDGITQVRVYKASGTNESLYLDCMHVLGAGEMAIAPPSGLTAKETGSGIKLSWNDNSDNEDGFKIERSTDGVNFSQIATVGPNTESYTD